VKAAVRTRCDRAYPNQSVVHLRFASAARDPLERPELELAEGVVASVTDDTSVSKTFFALPHLVVAACRAVSSSFGVGDFAAGGLPQASGSKTAEASRRRRSAVRSREAVTSLPHPANE
jgi:hypothetical protein